MTLAERRAYQREEREAIAQIDPLLAEDLAMKPTCVGCGCSEQLACPDGCGWAEVGLCSACAADGVRLVDVALTLEQARHTGAFLRASVAELDEPLRKAWEHTPVGQVWAVLDAAVTEDDAAAADERSGSPASGDRHA